MSNVVNITVVLDGGEHKTFCCNTDKTVGWAKVEIRSMHCLQGGGITLGGVVQDSGVKFGDMKEGGDLQFVEGKGLGGLTREDLGDIMDEKLKPMNRALNCMLESALDPWENIRSIGTEAIIAASTPHINDVCIFYGVAKKRYCMVLGSVTHSDIICSHIWPSHTYGNGLSSFDLQAEDVNSPRNFLRLHKDIERAFDHKRLYFEYVDGVSPAPIVLRIVLLDPAIFSENINVNNGTMPFRDVHEKVLDYQFVGDKKPFLRLLSLHADRALLKARSMNWIPDEGDVISRRARNVDLARLSLEPNHHEVLDAFFGK